MPRRWRHKATCPHGNPWYLTEGCPDCPDEDTPEVFAFLPAAAFSDSGELTGYMVLEIPGHYRHPQALLDRIGQSITQ